MNRFEKAVVNLLVGVSGKSSDEIEAAIEVPPKAENGDRALPCFRWAKAEKKSPKVLAEDWRKQLMAADLPPEIERVETTSAYLNFFFHQADFSTELLDEVLNPNKAFGFVENEIKPLAVIEFSSPNIAKPFSIGHLRSTNIGASISRIFEARGWRVIRINHLGDWGTQFGKLISAYRRWGNAERLNDTPIHSLYKLYVRWHEEEVSDPTLIEEAREWFSRLERGDEEAQELWQWFRDLTLRELSHLYKKLSVDFDHHWGESHYVGHLEKTLAELEDKKLTRISDEATIVDLEPHGLPICVVKKSDDSSLYLTRDLAAAIFRHEVFPFDRMIYVVGVPQRLHFQQLFKTLELMGKEWSANCEHVGFGHISFGDESMSTRKGNIVFLSDVLEKAGELALQIVEEKNPDLEDKAAVAKDVGVAAILFADLSSKRIKDVRFSWEDILSFDGETGPYLQYSLVRARSILRRYEDEVKAVDATPLASKEERLVIREIASFPSVLAKAEREREPFYVAQYLIGLARVFNRFYSEHRILDAPEDVLKARIALVASVATVLESGMRLIGIPRLERM